jgi:exopolysaccharide biosynthesis WecB/TagA/CpsF family protein
MVKAENRPLRIWLLGVPIDHTNRQQTVNSTMELTKDYSYKPSYIATINTDFIANAIGWTAIKDREFIKVLRKAKIATADGMPLVYLSRLLGNPLPERVTGQDLFPILAEAVSEMHKSLFLLGGDVNVLTKCSSKLLMENPLLKIAGELAPHIHLNGKELQIAPQKDHLILDKINNSQTDLLFLQLGSPKQELWFSRVETELKVPVVIGIGGAFERYTGLIKRAPHWMQSSGFEWIWRLIQEPKRLFKRYLMDGLKFLWLSIPLSFVFYFNKLRYNWLHEPNCPDHCERYPYLYLSPKNSITVVKLPCLLDQSESDKMHPVVEDALEQDIIVIDFEKTRHIDLYGCYFLYDTWKKARQNQKPIFAIHLKPSLKTFFKLNRLDDIILPDVTTMPSILDNLNTDELFQAIHQDGDTVTLSFLGSLNNERDYDDLLRKLLNVLENKKLDVDLSYVTELESRGKSFLLQLQQARN